MNCSRISVKAFLFLESSMSIAVHGVEHGAQQNLPILSAGMLSTTGNVTSRYGYAPGSIRTLRPQALIPDPNDSYPTREI